MTAVALVLSLAQPATTEESVERAVVVAYVAEVERGIGVADPGHRRRVILEDRTISVRRYRLRQLVFSPENDAQATRAWPEVRRRLGSLMVRQSRVHAAIQSVPAGVARGTVRIGSCGPLVDSHRYAGALAISRPAVDSRANEAIIYVTYPGGGRVYCLQRHEGRWAVTWHVELWACG